MDKGNKNYQRHVHKVLKELRRQTNNGSVLHAILHYISLSTHTLCWCALWLWHDSYWTYVSVQEYYAERA